MARPLTQGARSSQAAVERTLPRSVLSVTAVQVCMETCLAKRRESWLQSPSIGMHRSTHDSHVQLPWLAIATWLCMESESAGGLRLFSVFYSGHSREERLKAQNYGTTTVVGASAVIRPLPIFEFTAFKSIFLSIYQ